MMNMAQKKNGKNTAFQPQKELEDHEKIKQSAEKALKNGNLFQKR